MANQQLTGLYLITDHDNRPDNKLFSDVTEALLGGVRIIQYRDKTTDENKRLRQATRLRQLTREHQCLFIINDDIVLAEKVEADGVHVGKHDNSIAEARSVLGEEAIIGVSCYNKAYLAIQAYQQGANYIAYGRFFPSSTKPDAVQATPDLISSSKQSLNLPIVAIGGITQDNAPGLIKAGADMVAVINAVFGQPDIMTTTKQFQQLFTQEG